MASSRRVLLPLIFAACGAPTAPARPAAPAPAPAPAPPPAPAASTPAADAPPAAPALPPQVFADADPGFAFLDPDRVAKLTAALPAIDAAVTAEMARQKLPGLALGVVIDGQLVHARGFGVAELETRRPPDADTVYRIGSITKSVTGLTLLALRDAGKLGLDDPLARWIPEAGGLVYPSRDARPITLRQLHSHTSGLPRLGSYDGDHGPTEEMIVKSLPGFALEYAPGTDWRYSNLAYSLLGIVIGRADGAPFEAVAAKRLLGPLGMTSTYWAHKDVPAGRFAPAYAGTPAGPKPTEPADRGAGNARGGMYSTVRDMARYVALQLSAYPPRSEAETGPVRRATLREAHATGGWTESWARPATASKPGEPLVAYSAKTYGFGWVREQTCDFDDLTSHNGVIDSHRAYAAFLPTRGVGVVVLSNFEVVDPTAIGNLALAELARTGALVKRVPRLAPALPVAVERLLAVQNAWDEAAYRAMVDPSRPPLLDEERAELAGYRGLHGACRSASPLEIISSTTARFRVACERGALELEVSIAPASGLVTGFIGTSRGLAVPPALRRRAEAISRLIGAWDEGAHRRELAQTRRPAAEAKPYFAELRAAHGACRLGEASRVGSNWQLDLACDRGAASRLHLSLRGGDPAALEDYRVAPAGRGCPRR